LLHRTISTIFGWQGGIQANSAFSCQAKIFQKESEMSELSRYDEYVRQARLERTKYIGELIANMIFAAWNGVKHVGAILTAPATPAAKRHGGFGIADPR
jgi:hypothetical protein